MISSMKYGIIIVLGNVFVPLNDGGLRSNIAPTVGVEFTF